MIACIDPLRTPDGAGVGQPFVLRGRQKASIREVYDAEDGEGRRVVSPSVETTLGGRHAVPPSRSCRGSGLSGPLFRALPEERGAALSRRARDRAAGESRLGPVRHESRSSRRSSLTSSATAL